MKKLSKKKKSNLSTEIKIWKYHKDYQRLELTLWTEVSLKPQY